MELGYAIFVLKCNSLRIYVGQDNTHHENVIKRQML